MPPVPRAPDTVKRPIVTGGAPPNSRACTRECTTLLCRSVAGHIARDARPAGFRNDHAILGFFAAPAVIESEGTASSTTMAGSTSWVVCAVLGIAGSSLVAGCDEDDVVVVQTTRQVMRIYEEQARGWDRWALGEPHSTGSPIADPTGELCDVSQSDGVWYLAGTFGGPV